MPFGGGGSSSSVQPVGQQTTVQRSEPWDQQKGHLANVYNSAQYLYANAPKQYYPGSTVVQQSGQTLDALNAMENRARTGSPIQGAGADQYLKTLQGGYLNSNPYLDAMYDRAARPLVRNFQEAVAPTIQGNFAKAGRYGSEAYRAAQGQAQDTLSRSLGEMATDIYGRSYESERARQDAAMKGAPEYAQSDYLDAMRLMGVGGQHEAQAGLNLQDQVNRWNFAQAEPWARLMDYNALVSGNAGQTSTMTQPIYRQQQNTIGNIFQGLGGLGLLGLGFL